MVLSQTALQILEIGNLRQIKVLVLALLMAYSVLGYFLKDEIDKDKSYMHYWAAYLSRTISSIYIFFSPMFFMFLLKDSITLEIFYTIILAFYFLAVALFIGMSLYFGSSEIFRIYGFDDWNEFKDKMKERKSMRKYG